MVNLYVSLYRTGSCIFHYLVELQNLPDRTLFLLDLGKFVAEWDDEMQRLLHVALSDTIAAVIAFTGGSYDGKQLSNGLARVIGRCEELCFKQYIIRYSTLEAKYYIRTNEKHVSYTEFQNIRKATNWNPLLLHQFVLSHNDESLDKVLQYIEANISMSLSTGSLVGGIFETSSEPGVISYCTSIYVLKMAARNATVGELDIPIETVKSCYFVIENLIVIEEDHLVLAHPIFYRKFMLLLMNLQKKIDSDKYISSQAKRIIDGFAFEVEFLKLIPKHQLILRCSNHDHKEFLTSVKFNDINILKTAFVKKPIPGTLYHLRPKHPVIDMIGSCDGHLWLLQLSLQPYRSHKTKFKDLFEQFPTLEFGKNTIISYYAALFGTCEEKVVYIYVSPQQYKIPEISDDHVKKSKKYTIGIVNDTDFIKQVQDNLPFGGTAWS